MSAEDVIFFKKKIMLQLRDQNLTPFLHATQIKKRLHLAVDILDLPSATPPTLLPADLCPAR